MSMIKQHPEIMRIAERRERLISDGDLERLGLTTHARRRFRADENVHRLARGVYAVGSERSPRQWELAVCLALPGAVLSHSSAAAYWEIRGVPRRRGEITIPKGKHAPQCPLVVHHSTAIPEQHVVATVQGARVTSPARTIFDLGGVLDAIGHRSAIEDVRNRRLCTDDEIGEVYHDLCGRGRRGSAAWSHLVELVARAGRPTMSAQELAFQDALVAAGLPAAVQQHPVALPSGRMVYLDLAYVDEMLDIEIDHSTWHTGRSAVSADKARDIELTMIGWEHMRFPEEVVASALIYCANEVAEIYHRRRRALAVDRKRRPA